MSTVAGVLVRVAGGDLALATGSAVLSLRAGGEPVPASLWAGDEVAGWREGQHVREVRLARIRTDVGTVGPGEEAGGIRLDTGARLWALRAPGWEVLDAGAERLRVCHDGHLALWAASRDGSVWLPPRPIAPSPWGKLRGGVRSTPPVRIV